MADDFTLTSPDADREKEEQEAELTEWFDLLWETYPSDLCGSARNKGPRSLALKKVLKMKPGREERERILAGLRAQMLYDREAKSHGREPSRWPYLTTYLNQHRWEEEIDSHMEMRRRFNTKCVRCGAPGPEVDARGVTMCAACYVKEAYCPPSAVSMDDLRAAWNRSGCKRREGESKGDWIRRQVEYVKSRMGKIGVLDNG